ncbi:methyl-accepting chemotaxis protein [Mesorhizobium sp. CAU 1732]|uniref:methyl-accepting chemotaxis protein n=1 Tax=Mesorhizobium sp. CAU 1732 TaxID=3140358 RepID=UPI0032609A52
MFFANLNISRKLGLAFFAVVATIIAMSAAIYWNLSATRAAEQQRVSVDRILEEANGAEFRLSRQENSYRGFLLTNDAYYIERLERHRDAFDAHLATIRDLANGDAELVAAVDAAAAAKSAWWTNVVEAGQKFAADPIHRFKAVDMVGRNGSADDYMEGIESAIDTVSANANAKIADARATASAALDFNQTVLLIGVMCGVLIASALGVLLSRMIATPVNALTQVMGRLASGDNSVEIPAVARKDEIGEMARAVLVFKDAAIAKIRLEEETGHARVAAEGERSRNEMEKAREAEEDHIAISNLASGLSALANGDLTFRITAPFAPKTQKLKDDFNVTAQQLQETMADISGAIDGMRNGTGEISQAADDLSRRTEQQAASLEETAAALDQITATVRKTAEGAHQASDVTNQARIGAEKSGAVVREAVAAMAQIERSSQQIGQIIGVIDEIAFQTNLLALNAGVEAARAGEAGRGFAVVASEVRALAQRSAEAAKEIKGLISTSTQQVDQGVDLVGQTGVALEKILAQVSEITGLVTEIAASAREQSTGLGEVNSAVNQMDQVTQQNAAMVEQSTAASHSLAQEADDLARLVSKFRLGAQSEGHPARKVVAARTVSRPQPRHSAPALKTVSSGGGQAAALLAQQPADEGWEEF